MRITPMKIANAFRIEPERHFDHRGEFFEALRSEALGEAIGHPFRLAQVNYSVSRRGTIRGIHGTALPPGQAKLVTCVHGQVLDAVVDLRVGSPTFGQYEVTLQAAASGVSVYLADGLGHAFQALSAEARMCYFCSAEYVHGTMIEIDALDPEIGLAWPLSGEPVRSAKDATAPTLAEAARRGLLPTLRQCQEAYDMVGMES